jgi:hypothetical protein
MRPQDPLTIRVAGARGRADLILEGHGHSCGEVRNGIGARLDDERGCFVIDWASFEAAYLALKRTREDAERAYADATANPESWAAKLAARPPSG